MNLQIISTGSIGNCYLLSNEEECLIIDVGVKMKRIKKALDFDLSKVVGALQTHIHGDHSKGTKEALNVGIDVYMSKHDKDYMGITNHRAKIMKPNKSFQIGGFKILPFEVRHDVPCFGFLIKHADCGTTLYLTDTYYSPYKFANLHNIIIEANFSQKIIDEKVASGASEEFLRNRILKSHLSLENCVDLLDANDLTKVNNIVLIHLSDTNSHEADFKKCIEINTGKNVTVASNNMKINFKKTPF